MFSFNGGGYTYSLISNCDNKCLGNYAFNYCSGLEKISVDSNNEIMKVVTAMLLF